MSHRLIRRVLILALSFGVLAASLSGQAPLAPGAAADQTPPKDLRPLLSPRQSEMRLVTARYTLDRATLAGNYLGGMRIRGARGGAPAAPPEPLSPNRIARLERFDQDWLAALNALDASSLTPAAKSDLETLKSTAQSNLKQLDADAVTLARLSPLVPFAPAIVRLVESRIRLEDIDPEKAAGALTAVTNEIARVRAGLEKGAGGASPAAVPVARDLAARVPVAVDQLRSSLGEWFAFYNGYDPLFTWWNGLPYKKADAALQAYATFLREKIVPADGAATVAPAGGTATITPAAPPRYPSVPDLRELIALPQDEMTDIVQRFRGPVREIGRAHV
jgi:hypothetical protein